MGRLQKAKMLKVSTVSSVTPQPNAASKRPKGILRRKSEPSAKRKKLAQELDEELSDSEFDAQLDKMRTDEKQLKGKKFDNVKNNKDEDDSESEDDSEDEDDKEDSEDVCSDDDHDLEQDDEKDKTDDDDSDDEDVDSDDSDNEDTDDDVVNSEDEDGDAKGDDDSSDKEHKDATKSVAKSQRKKTRADSKKNKWIKTKKIENLPIEATEIAQDRIAKASMDKRTLFLKNLPQSVTEDVIQSFSYDVLRVRLKPCFAKKSRNSKCAYVEFSDEQTAVKNKANFERMKIGGSNISVDFVGEKSTFRPKKPQFPTSIDPRKLYISGVGKEATVEDLKKLFPMASSIDFPYYKKGNYPKGYAFIHFTDEKACKNAHATMQNQDFNGRVLTVMYGKKHNPETTDSKKTKQSSNRQGENEKTAVESVEKKENSEERDSSENDSD